MLVVTFKNLMQIDLTDNSSLQSDESVLNKLNEEKVRREECDAQIRSQNQKIELLKS